MQVGQEYIVWLYKMRAGRRKEERERGVVIDTMLFAWVWLKQMLLGNFLILVSAKLILKMVLVGKGTRIHICICDEPPSYLEVLFLIINFINFLCQQPKFIPEFIRYVNN